MSDRFAPAYRSPYEPVKQSQVFDRGTIIRLQADVLAPRCASYPEGSRTDLLPTGTYWVAAINVGDELRGNVPLLPNEAFEVVLYPASQHNGRWYRSSTNRYSIDMTRRSVRAHFGLEVPHVALSSGMIREYVKGLLEAQGHSEMFDPKENYDAKFKAKAKRILPKYGITDSESQDDMILEAMISSDPKRKATFDKEVLDKYDEKLGPPIAFLITVFERKLSDLAKKSKGRDTKRVRNDPNSEMTDEEFSDSVMDHSQVAPIGDEMETQQLLEMLYDQLEASGNKWMPMFFVDALDGATSKDIAEKYGVSQGHVSQIWKKVKGEIVKLAKRTKNDYLLALAQEFMKTRRTVTFKYRDVEAKFADFVEILNAYDRGIRRGSRPTGGVHRVRRRSVDDAFTDEAILDNKLDSGKTAEDLEEGYAQAIEDQVLADDVIEAEPGRLVLLERVSGRPKMKPREPSRGLQDRSLVPRRSDIPQY